MVGWGNFFQGNHLKAREHIQLSLSSLSHHPKAVTPLVIHRRCYTRLATCTKRVRRAVTLLIQNMYDDNVFLVAKHPGEHVWQTYLSHWLYIWGSYKDALVALWSGCSFEANTSKRRGGGCFVAGHFPCCRAGNKASVS